MGRMTKRAFILFLSIFNSCKALIDKDNQTIHQSVNGLIILVGCLVPNEFLQ